MVKISETELENYTVKISYEGGQKHLGSGFFVSPRLVLTCAHVCLEYKSKSFKIHHKGKEIQSKINLKFCSEDINNLDVALLEVEDTNLEFPYVLLDEMVKVGDELYSFGYPDNYEKGDVGTFEYIGLDGEGLFKFKEGNVRPGMSGSLLLNLSTKRVCGMVVITLDRNQALGGRGIPTTTIFKALAEVKRFQLSCYSGENPFIPLMGQVEKYEQIFGRESEIETIFQRLNNSSNGVALIGVSGMGKSSLLNGIQEEAQRRLMSPRKVVKIDFGMITEDKDFYYELCYQAGIECNYDNPLKGTLLKRELQKHRLLLLLDGLKRDMEWKGFTVAVREQLRSLADQGISNSPLKLVVTANQSLNKVFEDSQQGTSPFDNVCMPINLNPWNEGIIREFIAHRLRNNRIYFEESDIALIIQESRGHPKTVMQLCYNCYDRNSS